MTDVPAGKVPILESAGAALGYFTANVMRWIPAALLVGALTGLLMFRFPAFYISQLTGAEPVLSPDDILPLLGFSAIVMLASISFSNGVIRHSIFEEFNQPLGIQFAADELRVVGVFLGLSLILGIIGFFVMFIFGILLAGMAANSGVDMSSGNPEEVSAAISAIAAGPAGMIIAVLVSIAVCFLLFAFIRLSFVQAATVAENKMMAFSTWSLSQGNFWRVLAAILLVGVPVLIVHGLIQQILIMLLPLQPGPTMFIFGLVNGTSGALLNIISVALISYLYQGLRPSAPTESVFE